MRLVIVDAGKFGKTVKDIASQSGKYEKIVFIDDKLDGTDKDVIGKICSFRELIDDNTEFFVALENNENRYYTIIAIADAGGKIAKIIHPTAYVSPSATIGVGSIIFPNASIGTDAAIAYGCIINMNAVIENKVFLGVGVQIESGAVVKGNNAIEAFAKVESGEVIQSGEYPIADSSKI